MLDQCACLYAQGGLVVHPKKFSYEDSLILV
jgi:hypothetical protein